MSEHYTIVHICKTLNFQMLLFFSSIKNNDNNYYGCGYMIVNFPKKIITIEIGIVHFHLLTRIAKTLYLNAQWMWWTREKRFFSSSVNLFLSILMHFVFIVCNAKNGNNKMTRREKYACDWHRWMDECLLCAWSNVYALDKRKLCKVLLIWAIYHHIYYTYIDWWTMDSRLFKESHA